MQNIPFKLTDLENEHPKECIQAFIELHENRIEYITEYYSDVNDESLGWQRDTYHYYKVVAEKEAVKGAYINYRHTIDQYRINVCLTGFTDDFYIMAENESDAKDIFDKIIKWRFG